MINTRTDYRELCLRLFGTDDVSALEQIAAGLNKPNPRNAGRKRRFSPDDLKKMQELRKQGSSMCEIAKVFGTSRQIIGKYLSKPATDGCAMRMTYMWKQYPCTDIDIDFLHRKIFIQNYTDKIFHRAFGIVEHPTWEDFEIFLADRCFPPSRGDARDILAGLGLESYDPLQIVEKTNGRMAEDHMWMKFRYFHAEEPQHASL